MFKNTMLYILNVLLCGYVLLGKYISIDNQKESVFFFARKSNRLNGLEVDNIEFVRLIIRFEFLLLILLIGFAVVRLIVWIYKRENIYFSVSWGLGLFLLFMHNSGYGILELVDNQLKGEIILLPFVYETITFLIRRWWKENKDGSKKAEND